MGIPISRLNPAPSLLIGDYLPISTPDPSSPTGFSTFKATFQQVGEFIQVGPVGPMGPPGPVSPAQPSDIILSSAGLVGGMAAGPAQLITIGSGLSLSDGVLSSTASLSNPTAVIGLSPVNGTASSAMRSDSAPALSQAIAPTWSGLHTFSIGLVSNGIIQTSASTAAHATINIPIGVAPTSPVDGDLWYENGALNFRLGGATKSVALVLPGTILITP